MKVKLGQEMWVLDGELLIPWVKLQSGKGARGITVPKPLVLEKGQEVEVVSRESQRMDPVPLFPRIDGKGLIYDISQRVTDELLAEMGHTTDECACWCKGCNSGKHCHDQRCYPLYD